MKEIFRAVPNFLNYQVSNFGRVKSLSRYVYQIHDGKITNRRKTKEKFLKQYKNIKGKYISLYVFLDTKNRRYVHRLVAETFIPNLEQKPEVNHIDLDPSNNNVDNLEWVTHAENVQHSLKHYSFKRGEESKRSKLNEEKVKDILNSKGVLSYKELAIKHGVSTRTIYTVWNRIAWRHIDNVPSKN